MVTEPLAGLQIRPMAGSEVDAVLALERATEGAPRWERTAYIELLNDEGHARLRRKCLVVATDSVVAGFAVVRILEIEGTSESELESIVVAEAFRNQGLGRLLLEAVLVYVRTEGNANSLELEVRVSNRAARSLYQRTGLVETARRRSYYTDPNEDAVLMRINL